MANIVIQEILASDTVSDLVNKVNFNFDQLLLNGGGPAGPIGIIGTQGPIGPRGVVWFTSGDLYNTSLTTTPDPPLVFPLWTGTPLKVNNIALPNYPQFKGDPNRYQPYATAMTGVYPDYSFTIGTTGKLPKSGDLYLQEGDDVYQSYSSTDGDIWEFNAVTNSWSFTGVNIKGNTGGQGIAGATEWVRENDNSTNLNDYLRPSEITGNDPIVRVVIGADSVTADNIINESGAWSDNVLTLFQNVAGTGYQLAFTDDNSIQAPTFSTDDYAKIGTAANKLFIYGFDDTTSSNNDRDIVIDARAGRVVFNATDPIINTTQSAYLDVINRNFVVQNASLNISCAPATAPVAPGSIGVEHTLTDNTIALKIRHNQNATYGGWSSGTSIRLYASGPGTADMYLQELTSRLGVGLFTTNRVSGKLGINNSITSIPSLVVGSSWSTNVSITSSSSSEAIGNSSFFEGQVSIGTTESSGAPVKLGNASQNSISTKSSLAIQSGLVGFNTFIDSLSNNLAAAITSATQGNYFISPGTFLSGGGFAGSGAAISDLNGALVIAGSNVLSTTLGSPITASTIFTGLLYNPGIAYKSTTRQVAINAQKFTNSSSNATSNFISSGGAIIGKITRFTGDTLYGHEDDIVNNNIVIGYPLGAATNSPRVVLTGAGSSVSTPTANATYITTPVWNGSMAFDKTNELHTATIYSKSSYQNSATFGGYQSYLPSIRSQYKIVHGLAWSLAYSSMLNNTENQSNTPIGLEIETRHTSPNYAVVSTGSNRSPVITRSSGTYVPGNRPLLVTKRSIVGTNVSTLLEISPTNNVSVGQAISFPSRSIYQGNNDRTSSPSTSTYAIQDASSATSFVSGTSADTWYNITITNGSKFILPESNRSLHINSIKIDADLSITNNTNEAYDLAAGFIPSGVVINTDTINTSIKGGIQSAVDAYEDYYTDIAGYKHQITTPIISHRQQSAANRNMSTSTPLGIKPGYVAHTTPGAGVKVNNPTVVKGADLILEAGDIIYDRANGFNKFVRPGDVFITAGSAYRNLYQGGYSNARSDLSNASYVSQSTEMRNFGSIYLGSKATNISTEGYTSAGIVKSGLVYVGYQSDDTRSFTASTDAFSPIGKASLNVSASDISGGNTRDANALVSQGRALNIQQGDIVTRNQEAGWIEIDLTSVGVSAGLSNVIQCFDGSNRQARTTSVSAGAVTPKWLIKYKVIGYTVHFIISLEGLMWRTTTAGTGADATLIFITNAGNLFGTTPSTSLMPRPKEGDTSSVYSTSNNYNLPGTTRSQHFHATGSITLRNSYLNWPLNGAGIGAIGVITPIEAAWDNTSPRIAIYKSGSSAIQPMSSTTAPLSPYDPDLAKNVFSFRNYLLPMKGEELSGATAVVAVGSDIWSDIYISGTYELDPQYWF
jgi:hypothetical protein